jgi:hypothetical protein
MYEQRAPYGDTRPQKNGQKHRFRTIFNRFRHRFPSVFCPFILRHFRLFEGDFDS